jgi:ApbE superfamily uncharacterized protein (UPF0280 family)
LGKAAAYRERNYRLLQGIEKLIPFQVQVKETDLYIRAEKELIREAQEAIIHLRYQLENYIFHHPEFYHSFHPLPFDELAPPIVKAMLQASLLAGVGPMAAVAGAMAQLVGQELLAYSAEIIVENGGDIFLCTQRPLHVGIFAGPSPLSMRIGLKIPPAYAGLGICTSSASVGPSISLGKADAVCVISPSASLADAAATAIGNLVHTADDIPRALAKAQSMPNLQGIIIIMGEKLGVWGEVELINL